MIKAEFEALAQAIANYISVDNKKVRVDSLMVNSLCKKLSKLELFYSVNSKLVKVINQINPKLITDKIKPSLEKGNKNETIYRTQDIKADSKLSVLAKHSKSLYEIAVKAGEIITSTEEFLILLRILQEQTIIDNSNIVR